MKPEPDLSTDLFEADGLERLLERAERDPAASAELDLLADLVAAAEFERAHLTLRRAPPEDRRTLPLRSWILAAAASVLFLFALGLWYFGAEPGSAERALAALAAPRYVAAELRGENEVLSAAFARAMEPYAHGDWAAAARALEELLQRYPEHGPAHFYLAAASEQLGDGARAEREYQRATASPDALLAEHARLRLALTWLARGERERARVAFQALRAEGGELAPSAREWLETLER